MCNTSGKENMSKVIVEFKDVVKKYGEGEATLYANNHVSFTIDEGEFVCILGQSGAGKSVMRVRTTARLKLSYRIIH